MNIPHIISSLRSHSDTFKEEGIFSRDMIGLLEKHGSHAFQNDWWEDGHFTGSLLITNPSKTRVLLMFHKKLQRWLQFGGHSDGETNVLETAIREFHEESGILIEPEIFSYGLSDIPIFDIDIHDIPRDLKGRPPHKHYDIRFLGIIPDDTSFSMQITEVDDMKWFDVEGIEQYLEEGGLIRMIEKVRTLKNHE